MRISDWSSDVCSSDLSGEDQVTCIDSLDHGTNNDHRDHRSYAARCGNKASEHDRIAHQPLQHRRKKRQHRKNQYAKKKSQQGSKKERSEEHTSELQSLMRISYAVFCLKKKKNNN